MKRTIISLFVIISMSLLLFGCKKNVYIVEFETYGGTSIASITVDNIADFKLPDDPVKEGFLFVGWYLDSEFNEEFKVLTKKRVKLYAKWEENKEDELSLISFDVIKETTPNKKNLKNKSYDSTFKYDEILDGNQIKLEAVVKNDKRLSFVDMVLYLSYIDQTVVFNEGHGQYVCSTTTVYEDGLWLTKIEIVLDLEKSVESHSEVEIIDIYFLSLDKQSTKTYLLNSNKSKVTFHRHIYNQEVINSNTYCFKATHFAPEYYFYSCECGKIGNIKFPFGEPIPHDFSVKIIDEDHLAKDGNCTTKELYYYSCNCGEVSEETFETDYKHELDVEYLNDETLDSCGTKSLACTKCPYMEIVEINKPEYERGGTPTLEFKQLADGTFCVVGALDITERTKLVIPAKYNGKRVTKIGTNAFENSKNLITLIIAEGITTIESNAFGNCSKLLNITLPSTLVSIKGYAFQGCSALKNITIPDSATALEEGIFQNCISLLNITIPEGVKKIRESLFYNCISLTNITIPSSVTSIGYGAFLGCSSLKDIVIPEGVTNLDAYAFKNCTALTSIRIPSSVTKIGKSAFSGCSSTMKIITDDGYVYCIYNDSYALKSYIGNEDIPVIPNTFMEYYINCQQTDNTLKNIRLSEEYTRVGTYKFHGNENIETIILPYGITTIEGFAFSECRSLKSIEIPNSVTTIEDSAFFNCASLNNVTLHEGLISIYKNAFVGCKNLETLKIPNSVTYIGESAFSGCESIENIVIPEGITEIKDDTFSHCSSLKSLTIPEGVTRIGEYAITGCESLKSITIPNSVTSIEAYAFFYCTELKSISIPEGVTSIEEFTFYMCSSLESIVIPNSVTNIGKEAFSNSGLTSIIIPEGVTTINKKTFCACDKLTSIVIPNSVKTIEDSAFECCIGLTSIIIPNSVQTIGDDVFKTCYSLVIYCEATSKPNGWSEYWNCENNKVIWNYTK